MPAHPLPAHPLPAGDAPSTFCEPVPDVLGDDWTARTIHLAPDANPVPPVATLVHRPRRSAHAPDGPRRAVLYVHGFVDYFFQVHHARTWEAAGFAFFALDLRDYGRSIRPGREPNWVLDLGVYDEEITAAIAEILRTHDEVVLAGHSTGGLIVALYAAAHASVAGVVLNSPWLDLNEPWHVRRLLAPLVRTLGPLAPRIPISNLGSGYGQSLHESTGGQWSYNLEWKPFDGFGVRAGWLAAILTGHRRVARGLNIPVPVFMATSAARGDNNRPTPAELAGTDVVLSPPQMWRRAAGLGRDVTVVRIAGGRHDLTLSEAPARTQFAKELTAWLNSRFG